MDKKQKAIIGLVGAASLTLTACGTNVEPLEVPEIETEVVVTATPSPTATPIPTSSPEPEEEYEVNEYGYRYKTSSDGDIIYVLTEEEFESFENPTSDIIFVTIEGMETFWAVSPNTNIKDFDENKESDKNNKEKGKAKESNPDKDYEIKLGDKPYEAPADHGPQEIPSPATKNEEKNNAEIKSEPKKENNETPKATELPKSDPQPTPEPQVPLTQNNGTTDFEVSTGETIHIENNYIDDLKNELANELGISPDDFTDFDMKVDVSYGDDNSDLGLTITE